MAGIRGPGDLMALLGIGPKSNIQRREIPGSGEPIAEATENKAPASSGGNTMSNIAGILEGMLSGMRGDPYGPANQRMNQIKMGIAIETAKREAEESKLKHRVLQLQAEAAEQEAKLKQTPIEQLLTQETESVPVPEYNPEVSPGTGPIRPGATEERATGKYKLNIPSGISIARLESLKKIFGEEAVNRQLGMGKPEEYKASSGILYKPSEGPKTAVDLVGQREKTKKDNLVQFQDASGEAQWLEKGASIPNGWKPYKAPSEKTPAYDVIENDKGEQTYLEKGSAIPKGWKIAKGAQTSVTVNLEKSTKGELEKNIVEKGEALQTIRDTERLFKDDYLTWPGEARAWGETVLEKANISKGSKWLADRQEWYQGAKENLLKFRKFITGVAGGETEFKEIASAAPDPDRNSPTVFRSNIRKSKINTIKLIKRWQTVLNLTGKEPTKDQLSKISLADIKVEPWELGEDNPEESLKGKGLIK